MSAHPHTWGWLKYISRQWCTHCGLVWLKNARSDAAARERCRWWDD